MSAAGMNFCDVGNVSQQLSRYQYSGMHNPLRYSVWERNATPFYQFQNGHRLVHGRDETTHLGTFRWEHGVPDKPDRPFRGRNTAFRTGNAVFRMERSRVPKWEHGVPKGTFRPFQLLRRSLTGHDLWVKSFNSTLFSASYMYAT